MRAVSSIDALHRINGDQFRVFAIPAVFPRKVLAHIYLVFR